MLPESRGYVTVASIEPLPTAEVMPVSAELSRTRRDEIEMESKSHKPR